MRRAKESPLELANIHYYQVINTPVNYMNSKNISSVTHTRNCLMHCLYCNQQYCTLLPYAPSVL